MKKLLPVIVIVVLLLAGAGYYFYSKSPSMPGGAQTGNMFSSIKDALSKSLSLQCSFTDEQSRKTTAYIKAGAVRADVTGNDPSQQYNNSSVILKDQKMYIWDTDKKQGMMIAVKPEQVTGTAQQTQTGSSNQAGDMMAMLEKYKNDCKPAVVSDSLFTPPTDVAFQDLSKMMVPAVPTGANQQDVQKMMQQYQQQAPQGSSGY